MRTGTELPQFPFKPENRSCCGGRIEDKRLVFQKGKQRELLANFMQRHSLGITAFGRLIKVSKTTARDYFSEKNNIRLSTFQKLISVDESANEFKKFIEKEMPLNWGARKGGFAASSLIDERATYFARIREIKRVKNLHRTDIRNGIIHTFLKQPKEKIRVKSVEEYYPIEHQAGAGFCENLAKFIAHVQADGCQPKNTNTFSYANQNLHLIFEFSDVALKLFKVKPWRTCKQPGLYCAGFANKGVKKFLRGIKFYSIDWEVPYFVKTGDANAKASYLRAFFDDEGSVVFSPHGKNLDRVISMMLINKNGVLELIELLKCFEIECKFHGPYKEKYYELKISGKQNLIKFYERIGFIGLDKQKKLMGAINSYLS